MLKEGHKRHFYSSIYEALTLQTSHFTNVNLIMRANASSEVLLFRNCDNVFRVVAFFCQASIAISLGTTLDKTQKCTMSIVHERNWSLKSLLGFEKALEMQPFLHYVILAGRSRCIFFISVRNSLHFWRLMSLLWTYFGTWLAFFEIRGKYHP